MLNGKYSEAMGLNNATASISPHSFSSYSVPLRLSPFPSLFPFFLVHLIPLSILFYPLFLFPLTLSPYFPPLPSLPHPLYIFPLSPPLSSPPSSPSLYPPLYFPLPPSPSLSPCLQLLTKVSPELLHGCVPACRTS